jgi:hypothetical protein
MNPYRRKVLVAIAIIVACWTMALLAHSAFFAVLIPLAGSAFVLFRHYWRCERCASWKTMVAIHRTSNHLNPGSGTAHETRECWACGHKKFLSTYPYDEQCWPD